MAIILLLSPGCATVDRAAESNGNSLTVTELVKSDRSWDGALLPGYPAGQPEVTILKITIPPGFRLDTHRHPVINAGVLLSGQLTVITAEGDKLHLRAGDPIVEVVEKLHSGFNPGTVPAEIIVFYAGVIDKPITVIEPRPNDH